MNGTIRVKIEGLNSGKIINALVEKGVYLKNLKEKSKYVLFEIDQNSQGELDSVCKRFHRHYEIVSKNNLVNLFLKLKYCVGFLVAISIVFALVFSFNLYVYEVNLQVANGDNFDVSSIEQILTENGVCVGSKRKNIDTKKLQNLILSSEENVAGCSIKTRGGKIDVVIYPGIIRGEKQNENLYSKYDAVISKIKIFAGKSELKEGDFVKENDLLIENDNGASGEVFGKVYFSDYIIYNENQVKKVKTGKQIKKTNILIFGKNLFKRKKIADFSNYFEENCVFYISKNMFLPISLKYTTYSEFELVDEKIAFESVEQDLKTKLYESIKRKISADGNVTNVTFSVVKENNLTRLDCFVECEMDLLK